MSGAREAGREPGDGDHSQTHGAPVGLGRPRIHLRRIDSTNDRARELALGGAPHGTLVTADEQSAGRGRQGRHWSAPPCSSLLMSIVVRRPPRSDPRAPDSHRPALDSHPPAPDSDRSAPDPHRPAPDSDRPAAPTTLASLPLLAAVALCDAVGPDARIKWPNDVLLDGHKLAGILVEGRPQQSWAVVGIGVNVAVRITDLPAELRESAATLGRGRSAIEPFLAELLAALDTRLREPAAEVLRTWRERDALRGREIAWSDGRGRAGGIDDEGRLLVDLADGSRTALAAGEVHLGSEL